MTRRLAAGSFCENAPFTAKTAANASTATSTRMRRFISTSRNWKFLILLERESRLPNPEEQEPTACERAGRGSDKMRFFLVEALDDFWEQKKRSDHHDRAVLGDILGGAKFRGPKHRQ